MECLQVITILGTNLGMFIWARSESAQDRRQIFDLMKSIQDEMKDFHGRLCKIEERNKK